MENSSVLHFLYGANECLDADLRSQTVRVVSGRQKTGKVLGERLHSSQIRSDFAGTLFHRNKSARLRRSATDFARSYCSASVYDSRTPHQTANSGSHVAASLDSVGNYEIETGASISEPRVRRIATRNASAKLRTMREGGPYTFSRCIC